MHPTTETKLEAAAINALADLHQQVLAFLADYAAADVGIARITAKAEAKQMEILMENAEALKEHLAAKARCEAQLENLARTLIGPEDEERSVATPFGTIKLTRTSALVSPEDGGDEAVVALIEKWANGELPTPEQALLDAVPCNDVFDDFLRHDPKLNREALERLPDDALRVLRLIRVRTVSFSIKRPKLTAEAADKLLDKARRATAGQKGAPKS